MLTLRSMGTTENNSRIKHTVISDVISDNKIKVVNRRLAHVQWRFLAVLNSLTANENQVLNQYLQSWPSLRDFSTESLHMCPGLIVYIFCT